MRLFRVGYTRTALRLLHPVFCADILQAALTAIWLCSCRTDVSAVIDQPVAEITSFFRRYDLPQCHLHFLRFFYPVYKPHTVYEANTMSICHDGRLPEHIAHDQIRTFTSYSRQFQQCVKILRNLAAVFFFQYLHAGADVPRLTLPEPAGPDNPLYILNICLCKRVYIRKFGIQIFHNHIYPCVRTLCRQPHTDQQFPCLVIIQGTSRIRLLFLQALYNLQSQFFFCHMLYHSFPYPTIICSAGSLRTLSLGCVFPANIRTSVSGPSLPIYIITIRTI